MLSSAFADIRCAGSTSAGTALRPAGVNSVTRPDIAATSTSTTGNGGSVTAMAATSAIWPSSHARMSARCSTRSTIAPATGPEPGCRLGEQQQAHPQRAVGVRGQHHQRHRRRPVARERDDPRRPQRAERRIVDQHGRQAHQMILPPSAPGGSTMVSSAMEDPPSIRLDD